MNPAAVKTLMDAGDIVECAACGELNAFSWQFVDEQSENPGSTIRLNWKAGEIAHIDSSSCFDWTCGHCEATNVDPDSPTLAEVYTHQPLDFEDS